MSHPEKIGKYEILDKIGEGGFGVVYKGRDPFIKRLVAVKTCTSEESGIRKRFFLEAEIAGNLHHDNVVTIHDFGVEQKTPYLVQEYLEGEDLDLLIERRDPSLTLRNKVRYLRGVAEGLGYAHAQGVIHRDVKPSNIRVLGNGQVKVMDFGIAKLKDQESRLTATGMTVGTVAYLSPEQLQGQTIDHRADIFSFGVVAYELLSGSRPFQGDSISELFQQLLNEDPAPLAHEELPAELTAIVDRCLQKKPEERYGHLSEVVSALDEVRALLPADPDSTNPFWPGRGSTLARPDRHQERVSGLADKARRALDAKDLTAAEMTLSMARRDLPRATFDRQLGPLAEALEELKTELEQQASSAPSLSPAAVVVPDALSSEQRAIKAGDREKIDSALREIRARLERRDLDSAAIRLLALEQQHPDLPEIESLNKEVSQAHREKRRRKAARTKKRPARTTSAPPSHQLEPPSASGSATYSSEGRVPTRGPLSFLGSFLVEIQQRPRWLWAAVGLVAFLLVLILSWIF